MKGRMRYISDDMDKLILKTREYLRDNGLNMSYAEVTSLLAKYPKIKKKGRRKVFGEGLF